MPTAPGCYGGMVCLCALHTSSKPMFDEQACVVVVADVQALIWSAVAASSAFPGLFHPQDLLAKDAHGDEVR